MAVIDKLLRSKEPSIRYKTQGLVLGESKNGKKIKRLRNEIMKSQRVQKLLRNRRTEGKIEPAYHIYKKWAGAHWILATLADIVDWGGVNKRIANEWITVDALYVLRSAG